MSIPNYLYALANHKGAAYVSAGGLNIPVKLMDIEHTSEFMSDETTFKCLVINADQIHMGKMTEDEYVRRQLEKSVAARNAGSKPTIERRSGRYPWHMEISKVIFNDPATIVIWADGTKTVVKCQEGDVYSKETGLALCIAKKALGNQGNFNDIFHKWIPEEEKWVYHENDASTMNLDFSRLDASVFSKAMEEVVDAMLKVAERGAQDA